MIKFYNKLQKVIYLLAYFALFFTSTQAQTLTLSSIDAGPYTPGSSIAVPFNINTSSGCINPDNVFTLYISSVQGGTPDTPIGSYTGFYIPFINGVIPGNLAPGNGYNLAIKASLPAVTSSTASINIVTGTAVMAAIDGSSINSDNPEIFGNCSGTTQAYDFINSSTDGTSVTATFRNEFNQRISTAYTLNPSTSFNADYANYTILVKATIGGTEGTKAYQLINNNLNTNFGTTGNNTVCLSSSGRGTLSYTVDYQSSNGVQYNYPGNLYIVNWGDGTKTIYTLCDIIASNGRLTHDYVESSCGMNNSGQANSYQVNAQVSSRVCGALGSPTTVYAKVVKPPTNSFSAPNSACLGDVITFNNTSYAGQDASSANCENTNARYAWYVDGQLVATNRPGSYSLPYTFTTSGIHRILLRLLSQSGSVCGADDVYRDVCIQAKPQPAFTVDASTICSDGIVTTTDRSVTDPSCANIPENNAYTWTVTGPAATSFINNTTPQSHSPQIQFFSPGVYTLTLSIGTESCGNVSTSQTITVNTTPTVNLSPDNDYCGTNQTLTFANNAGATQVIFTGTTTDQTNTYNWTISGGTYTFINGTGPSSKYPQILFSDFGIYTVTATQTNNCGTASDSQQLNFKQSPNISAGADQTICPDTRVQLAGTITGPAPQSYQWVGGNGAFSPNNTTLNAVYTPTDAEIAAGQVKLTLVVQTGNPVPCDQLSDEVVITINPRNAVTSSASKSICTGNSVAYHPTAQQTGSTFSWTSTVTSGNISNNTNGSGSDITDVLTNNDPNSNGTVTYTITPIYNGCPGTSFTLTVLVTPIPRVIITHSGDQICSNNPTGITFTTNVPGVKVTWTSDDVPGIYSNNDQPTPILATRIDDVLQSGRTTPATIVYHITPIIPDGCEGPTVDASVTVLPVAVTANAGADAQICNTTVYTLNGNDPAPSTGKWTVASGQTNVVFSDDTKSNTTVSGLQPGQDYTFRWTITSIGGCSFSTDDVLIRDFSELTNTISFNSPAVCYGQTVTISGNQPTGGTGSFVYTWESSADGNNWTTLTGQSDRVYTFIATQNIYLRRIVTSGPCTKISNVIQLLVQPPIANNTIAANQSICYNNTPVLLTGTTPTGGDGNFNYQWQYSSNNGASWNSISGANAINYQPVALMITTQFRRVVTTGLCVNDQQNSSNLVTITVTPQNTNTVTSANNITICTGTSVAYHPTAQEAGTVFTWVSSASAAVSGNTASGSGDINDVLVNADPTANGTVTYTITPINNDCPGATFTLLVNVMPRPILSVNATANTICSGQPTGITFSANLSGTTFKWTSNASAGIYGNNNQQPVFASRIDDVLNNASATTSGTATYVITPIGPTGCEGAPVTVTITVQPAAVQANAGPDEQICSTTEYVLKGNDPGTAAGRWLVTSGQTVVFADLARYNTTVSGLLPGQQYTFRWTITGAAQCTATSDDVVITDLQSVTNNISFAGPVCYGQTVTISGDQAAGGNGSFVYAWETSNDNSFWTIVNGQTNRNYTFTGTQTVYVRRTATSGPCTSVSAPVLVEVQPAISNNLISADQVICYNNTPAALTGSMPAGANGNYIYQWQQSTNGGSVWANINSANGINYQPDALTATTQFRRVVTSALCTGSQQSISNAVVISVTPQNKNTLTSDASRAICTGTTFSYHPTAQQSNTVFTWVSSATANISGNSATGSGDIHEALINSDPNNNGTVTYTITPINNNCPGIPFTLTVTVTPIPKVIITHDGSRICSGNPTGITFTTNNLDVKLRWSFDRVAGISGANDQYPVIATRIDDILQNSLTNEITVVYHITPISVGGCEGPTVDATVTVLPQPLQANAGPDEQICSTNNYTFKGNEPAPSTGNWTVTSGQLGIGFADASKYNTTANGLQPGQTYTFRWTITSPGNCNATSDEVTVMDLKAITNNVSYANPAVCYGQTVTINGEQPTGGTGSFVYAWEISLDNSTWTMVNGETNPSYSFTGTQSVYVRRIVTSGPCTSVSTPVFITVQQPITNNTVAADQQVCYNSAPNLMTGSAPAGADSRYTYQWQSSTDNGATWTNISGANLQDYQAGQLTVSTWYRRVVSSALCTGPQQSISNTIKMTVNPVPVAAYTFGKDLACIPFAITADNIKATASDANSAYNWYADGTLIGSGPKFPGYTINTDDAHVEIKLVASSKYGCADAVFTHVFSTIKEVKAGFTQNQTKGCGPLAVTFTNTSDPQNLATYSWNFGNGTTSTQANPNAVTYAARTDGRDTTYNVTLTATTTCGIRTAASTVVVRPKPVSIFTPDKTTGCSPLTVNFNNTSPGTGNTYTWDFGDGTTLVTNDNRPVNHTYIAPNNKVFTAKMTAQNECGISTTSYKISIAPNTVLPQLIVNGDQKAGCAPWTVNFYNNTKGGTYFTYDFGDGTTLSSVSAPEVVSHTFLKDGIYNVVMKATNGCSDTSASQSITVYPQPVVGFAADVTKGCTQLTVNFTNKTAGNNTYLWDFGDGSTSNTANPTHTFQARNTPYTISLIAKNLLNCPDTSIMKNYIMVTVPPKAAFRATPDSVIVYPNYRFSFRDQSTNAPILWKWSFGDGSTSTKQNPEHTYADTGVYKVKLVVYNLQGCADTITHKVQITGVPGQLFVPNAFMPNSKFDELKTFKAKGSGLKTWRMRVFNKWGQVIWESTKLTARGEPAEGWDGMMNGAPAPQGVYVWQIEGKYQNGNDWEGMSYKGSAPSRTGFIHLIQ